MRRFSLALASLLVLPIAAHADSFVINLSVAGSTGTATLTGDGDSSNGYLITSITGPGLPAFAGMGPITVIPPNDPTFLNDNLFFPTQARLVDVDGIAFSGDFGTANLFSTVSGFEVVGADQSGTPFDLPATVSLVSNSATPEPSSAVLAFTGLVALGALAFRKCLAVSLPTLG